MIRLHYGAGNASLAPHMLLEELGVPYELKLVDRAGGEQHTPEYRRLNPNGLVPVLEDGDLVLYESTAICFHLVDTHPDGGFAPPVGTPERAHYYKWSVWLTNTLQTALISYFHPEHHVDASDEAASRSVKEHAERRVAGMLDQLDAELARTGGPWLLGARFTSADLVALMLGRWTRNHARPARSLPHLGPYLRRVLERPAVQRTFEQEGLSQPWI
ncbi:MAG: glutathione S-transferase family protein [Planctomycetota bacterium]